MLSAGNGFQFLVSLKLAGTLCLEMRNEGLEPIKGKCTVTCRPRSGEAGQLDSRNGPWHILRSHSHAVSEAKNGGMGKGRGR